MVIRERPTDLDEALLTGEFHGAFPLGQVEEDRLFVLSTCQATWLFDTVHGRFCRLPTNGFLRSTPASDWQPYDQLLISAERDAFVLLLDPSGSRVLRARAHKLPCPSCGASEPVDWKPEYLARFALL